MLDGSLDGEERPREKDRFEGIRRVSEDLVLCLGSVVDHPPFFFSCGIRFSMLCFDGLDGGMVIFLV